MTRRSTIIARTLAAGAGAAVVVAWQIAHRTSPLVQKWQPSTFRTRRAGPLRVRDSGPPADPDGGTVVLLHGLGATGNYFGHLYDDLHPQHRVVIVDLLGFGGSLDEHRTSFTVDDHVDALDDALNTLLDDGVPVVLAAHSMSTAVALTWADRNPDRAEHIYLWGAPIYPPGGASDSVAKHYGLMGRLFVLDTRWAELACRMNCWNRDLSGWAMALMAPRWPTGVSRAASRHTWPAYHQSLRNLILDFDWTTVLPSKRPVTLLRGTKDPVGDRGHVDALVGKENTVDVRGATHHVALEHPELLRRHLC